MTFADKQHNYILISISEWPLCLCEQTDGPIVGPDAWEQSTNGLYGAREEGRSSALMESDKSHFNEVKPQYARQRDRGQRKKEATSVLSLPPVSSLDL